MIIDGVSLPDPYNDELINIRHNTYARQSRGGKTHVGYARTPESIITINLRLLTEAQVSSLLSVAALGTEIVVTLLGETFKAYISSDITVYATKDGCSYSTSLELTRITGISLPSLPYSGALGSIILTDLSHTVIATSITSGALGTPALLYNSINPKSIHSGYLGTPTLNIGILTTSITSGALGTLTLNPGIVLDSIISGELGNLSIDVSIPLSSITSGELGSPTLVSLNMVFPPGIYAGGIGRPRIWGSTGPFAYCIPLGPFGVVNNNNALHRGYWSNDGSNEPMVCSKLPIMSDTARYKFRPLSRLPMTPMGPMSVSNTFGFNKSVATDKLALRGPIRGDGIVPLGPFGVING